MVACYQILTSHRKFYNTVKGWYQRTFDDWSSHSSSKTKQPPPNPSTDRSQYTLGHPGTNSAYPLQQQQQGELFQNRTHVENQQASYENSYLASSHPRYLDAGESVVTPEAIPQTFYNASSHHYPQADLVAPSYDVGQFDNFQGPLPQQPGLGHISGNTFPFSYANHVPSYGQNQLASRQTNYCQPAFTPSNTERGLVRAEFRQELGGRSSLSMGDTVSEADGISMNRTQFPYPESPSLRDINQDQWESERRDLSFEGHGFFYTEGIVAPKQPLQGIMQGTQSLGQVNQYRKTSVLAVSGSAQLQPSLYQQGPNEPDAQQTGRSSTSKKHHRTSSTFLEPTPPPQRPLPPDPPVKTTVIRNRRHAGWQLMYINQGNVVPFDPNKLPKGPSAKRARGLARKSHDSMALYPEQAVTTQTQTSGELCSPSNTSIHSSTRDSGYVSLVDSTVHESLDAALSTMKLTGEADDGWLDVEITTKGRMRRSRYIEKMGSPPYLPPE